MDEIKFNRSVIDTLEFANPYGKHGGINSGTVHLEIEAIIKSSLDYNDFKTRLRMWADYRLPEYELNGKKYPGSAGLPGNLRNYEAFNYSIEDQPQEQIKENACGI